MIKFLSLQVMKSPTEASELRDGKRHQNGMLLESTAVQVRLNISHSTVHSFGIIIQYLYRNTREENMRSKAVMESAHM